MFRADADLDRTGGQVDPQFGERGTVDGEQVHRRGPDEPGDEGVHRIAVEVLRRIDLLQDPVLEHGDAMAHRHRLDLVVGDVDGGDVEVLLQLHDLCAGLDAQLGVQVGQRLVHEEDLRLADDRAAHRHTLALATGEVLRLAVEELGEVEDLGGALDPLGDLGLGTLLDRQRKAHVLPHGHVWVQGVVLEDHRDVAVTRLFAGDVASTDGDDAGVGRFQTGQGTQGGGLTATGRSDEDEELAVGDLQVQVLDRGGVRARVPDIHVIEDDVSHGDGSYRRLIRVPGDVP